MYSQGAKSALYSGNAVSVFVVPKNNLINKQTTGKNNLSNGMVH